MVQLMKSVEHFSSETPLHVAPHQCRIWSMWGSRAEGALQFPSETDTWRLLKDLSLHLSPGVLPRAGFSRSLSLKRKLLGFLSLSHRHFQSLRFSDFRAF